jgi:hypothetical protein
MEGHDAEVLWDRCGRGVDLGDNDDLGERLRERRERGPKRSRQWRKRWIATTQMRDLDE